MRYSIFFPKAYLEPGLHRVKSEHGTTSMWLIISRYRTYLQPGLHRVKSEHGTTSILLIISRYTEHRLPDRGHSNPLLGGIAEPDPNLEHNNPERPVPDLSFPVMFKCIFLHFIFTL